MLRGWSRNDGTTLQEALAGASRTGPQGVDTAQIREAACQRVTLAYQRLERIEERYRQERPAAIAELREAMEELAGLMREFGLECRVPALDDHHGKMG